MRILMTGATGFLGSHLCRTLVQRGHAVLAYRRAASDISRVGAAAAGVTWLDVTDLEAPFRGRKGLDLVVHCAALYGRRGESVPDLIQANTLLPARLHRLACDADVPLLVHTGTVLDPHLNPYALSKHHAEEWLKMAGGPTRVVNLKVQHFYGPDDDPTKFITGLITRCLANEPEIQLTDGRQQRDFIHVDDVVGAILMVVEDPLCPPPSVGKFLNVEVGSGEPVKIRELVEQIHHLTGSRTRLVFGALPYRPGEPMLTRADTTLLRSWGWRPIVPLEAGLRSTVLAEQNKFLSSLKT